ncbi:MAG: hydroxyacid dehydrogenase [Anaerolineales bacterium]
MTWRVQIADRIAEVGVERLRERAEVVQESSLTDIGQMDALIVRGSTQVGRQEFERGRPRLKVIGRAGVGVDNIDLDAAAEHQVIVVNAPLAATNAVAEHALGLMFALSRHMSRADARMKQGEWPKKALLGMELSDHSLGVLGMGRIGSALAVKATALGMNVLGCDPPLADEEITRRGAKPTTMSELLGRSEFLSIHVPLTEDTRGLIGRDEFSRMRPGARLVCTSRGGVVNEDAMLEALESGQLAAAGLDVFESEPPGRTELVLHPNVIATPHLGAQTVEAQTRASKDIADEVLAALAGDELRWRVI